MTLAKGSRTLSLPKQAPLPSVAKIRAMSALVSRFQLAQSAGLTFENKRDMYSALGYKKVLTQADFRDRFNRGGIAGRVVDAMPKATWRGGGELIEDENPDVITDFELAFFVMAKRLKLWSYFQRADILAGLGRYAILMLGAPGKWDSPLPAATKPEDLAYLAPYTEDDAPVTEFDEDTKSPRCGMPTKYTLKAKSQQRSNRGKTTGPLSSQDRIIHWTRVIHIADGCLDDHVYGEPRMERCWNLLDDLEKVTGGGAEAFWMRAHQGTQFDLDKDMELDPEDEEAFEDEIDEYKHGLSRIIKTRGITASTLGSDVANFGPPADSITTQIAGATGVPKRILMGSERGDLASTQDRSNWHERVNDRRTELAGPWFVAQMADRLIEFKYLPTPAQYEVRWPQIQNLDELERASVATKWASLNNYYKGLLPSEVVVTRNEVRDRLLDLEPLDEGVGDPNPNPANPDELPPDPVANPNDTNSKHQRLMKRYRPKNFRAALRNAAKKKAKK